MSILATFEVGLEAVSHQDVKKLPYAFQFVSHRELALVTYALQAFRRGEM